MKLVIVTKQKCSLLYQFVFIKQNAASNDISRYHYLLNIEAMVGSYFKMAIFK